MYQSLCVLLPVHNAESSIALRLAAVLDVAAELTSRFEILVLDNASSDATYEQAVELAQVYPQVSVLRIGELSDGIDLVYRGMNHTPCDVVIAHVPGDEAFQPSGLVRLWHQAVANAALSARHVRQGKARRALASCLTRIAELVPPRDAEYEAHASGGFRLCRPVLPTSPSYRRHDEAMGVPKRPATANSTAAARVARIRGLLASDAP